MLVSNQVTHPNTLADLRATHLTGHLPRCSHVFFLSLLAAPVTSLRSYASWFTGFSGDFCHCQEKKVAVKSHSGHILHPGSSNAVAAKLHQNNRKAKHVEQPLTSLKIISLIWLSFKLGFSALILGICASSYALKAAFLRRSG